MCQSGRCVSTCYPPCGFGQRCQDGGCVGAGATHADGTPRWNWDGTPPRTGEGATVPGQPPGFHRHDGFLLRGTLMVAGGGAFYDAPGGERELGGGGLGVGIDLGWALSDEVALFARLASHGFSDEVSTDDDPDAPAPPAEDPSIRFGGGLLAAGLSYYLMPYNIYLGGTLGLLGADVDNVDADGIQDVPMRAEGYVIQLEGAKEWWVSANWAMGVGARLSFGGARVREAAPDDEAALEAIEDAGGLYEAQLRHFSLGLLGSVTYH